MEPTATCAAFLCEDGTRPFPDAYGQTELTVLSDQTTAKFELKCHSIAFYTPILPKCAPPGAGLLVRRVRPDRQTRLRRVVHGWRLPLAADQIFVGFLKIYGIETPPIPSSRLTLGARSEALSISLRPAGRRFPAGMASTFSSVFPPKMLCASPLKLSRL